MRTLQQIFSKGLFLILMFMGSSMTILAHGLTDSLPPVFKIGEYESRYANLKNDYSATLIDLNNGKLEMVDYCWQELLMQMEYHALKIKFDLSGVKLWIHVFWNKDGGIDHLAYHLKPESRLIDDTELSAFIKYFRRQFKSTVWYSRGFNHYSEAEFPLAYHHKK